MPAVNTLEPSSAAAASFAQLRRDEGGAIIVFGLCFAVFVLGMLYYMMGIGSAIYYRERLQDAADASAFGAAVVHARGMNTIALLNMMMAAVLSVLVTLKLIEALIIVAQTIMAVLSIFGGATASVASSLEVVRGRVHNLADSVKQPIDLALEGLHLVGTVVKVIVPVGANATVLGEIAKKYDNVSFAVAIPPRLTLPVEDDSFDYLCKKAAVMAGELAMLPLSPVLPGFIEDGVVKALSSLAQAGSGWFCGDKNAKAPEYKIPEQVEGWPISAARKECADYNPPEGQIQDAKGIELCQNAEKEDLMASPREDDGACREGQHVCIPVREDPDDPNSPYYEPQPGSYCHDQGPGPTLSGADCRLDSSSPYGRRLQASRKSCVPGAGKKAYWWIEQQVEVTWQWDINDRVWRETDRVTDSPVSRHESKNSTTTPCGLKAGEPGWDSGSDLSKLLCTTEELDDSGHPKPPPPPSSNPYNQQFEQRVPHTEVTQILGCGQTAPARTVKVDDLDLSEEGLNQASNGGNEGTGGSGDNGNNNKEARNRNPFQFETDHVLGMSDMQIRSVVIGESLAPNANTSSFTSQKMHDSDAVLDIARWNHGSVSGARFLSTAQVWGRLAVAQAEYYFDKRGLDGGLFANVNEQRDWLWIQGWTARLRRFRLKWEGKHKNGETISADPPPPNDQEGQNARKDSNDKLVNQFGLSKFVDKLKPDASSLGGAACKMAGDESLCNSSSGDMMKFDSMFIH